MFYYIKLSIKNDIKTLLQLYFIEVETSYEKIINIFDSYTITSVDMQTSYNVCTANINIKIVAELKNTLQNEANNVAKFKYEKQIKKLDKDILHYKNLYEKSILLNNLETKPYTSFVPVDIPENTFQEIVSKMDILLNAMTIADTQNTIENISSIIYNSDSDSE